MLLAEDDDGSFDGKISIFDSELSCRDECSAVEGVSLIVDDTDDGTGTDDEDEALAITCRGNN